MSYCVTHYAKNTHSTVSQISTNCMTFSSAIAQQIIKQIIHQAHNFNRLHVDFYTFKTSFYQFTTIPQKSELYFQFQKYK
jgi:hypothetical protein